MGTIAMLRKLILIIFVVQVACDITSNLSGTFNENSRENYREIRHFNDAGCNTASEFSGATTCMSRFNCLRQKGTIKGYCGYGICCETNIECNSVSKQKRTIIRGPTQILNPCQYTINAYSSNVCQLLVEFRNFELMQPQLSDLDGVLKCTDSLTIGSFELCGTNTGQHLYLPFNGAEGRSSLTMRFNVTSSWARTQWNLVVTQLECPAIPKNSSDLLRSSLLAIVDQRDKSNTGYIHNSIPLFSKYNSDVNRLAPPGCTQYYTQSFGTIRSFNHREDMNTLYPANLRYTICIKPGGSTSSIRYTFRSFSMSVADTNEQGIDENCRSPIETEGRREDYIMIPQSSILDNSVNRPICYCGEYLKDVVVQGTQPFLIYFVSDGITDDTETGFSLNYEVSG